MEARRLPFRRTLIIVLSSTLSTAPAVRQTVVWLSRLPGSAFQVTALAALLGAVTSYLYWGLGMALSPIAGVYFAQMSAFRDETALLLLIATGTFVYFLSILLLFGRGWIFSLIRG